MPTICLIPGDGIGQEVIPAAARVLAAVSPDLRFVEAEAGWGCFERHGTALPEATLAAVAAADATLFGATQSPIDPLPGPPPVRGREVDPLPLSGGGLEGAVVSLPLLGGGPGRGYRSPILTLRRQFDLYANLRPVVTLLPGRPAVDLLIVRENTEGLYSGREHWENDTAIAERVITRAASERIARVAFEQARRRAAERGPRDRQPQVTVVHKANVLKQSDGLFRASCMAVAQEYPDVSVNEMLVDAAAMWLAKDPRRFDVIVTTNLFGDILSDLSAGLVGGLGVTPSANVGAGPVAVFEPVHGSAPDIAGRGIANPTGALLSGAMLLDHLGRPEEARRLRGAVRATLAAGVLTPDLGGSATTDQVVEAVLAQLQPQNPNPLFPNPDTESTGLDLLRNLVAIPSYSGQESAAVAHLVAWMAAHGFDAHVDEVGNAVGVLDGGPAEDGAPPREIILLGHIDTVPGVVPIREEAGQFYGRGSVDAKGPLAAFAVAAARVGSRRGWRIIVVGAVEEEAATSKGARHIAAHHRPDMAVIGEPSGWQRLTLGYKGRLLADVVVQRAISHRSGRASSACELAVAFWNRVLASVTELNAGREKAWDQVLPSLRAFSSTDDGLTETAQLKLGLRLPPDLAPERLQTMLGSLADQAQLAFYGAEAAYRAEKNTPLVRAFLQSVRSQGGKPGFVLKTGTSDMNVVGPIWRCPILAYGPGDSRLDHTPEEHVDIAEWQRGVEVLAGALRRLLESG